jgi:hypothetical protein
MNKRMMAIVLLLLGVFLAACQPKGTSGDTGSAQSLQPSIAGFRTENLDTGLDAILTTAAGGSLATGNVPLVVAIQRGDAMLQCLQDTGSLSGLMYIQENPNIVPEVGTSIIINKTRVASNVLACLAESGFGAQSADDLFCVAQGEFTSGTDQYWFAYVGAGQLICTGFETHYTGLNATFQSRYP